MKAIIDDMPGQDGSNERELSLHLYITDPDVVETLTRVLGTRERDEYALAALRVGVLAIRQASGVLDGRTIHDECTGLLRSMGEALSTHSETVATHVAGLLGRYFDPAAGEFPQRIERLIRRDGELETILSKHLNGDASSLSKTLESHVGENSPLLKVLSPDQRKGVVTAIKETLDSVTAEHTKQICREFSLDDKNSALSRLVDEIADKNGSLRRDLSDDVQQIRREFSLDNEEGALARLVQRVERAHETILGEFSSDNEDSALSRIASLLEKTHGNIQASLSLDEEQSPLSRLRRELLNVLAESEKKNREFQDQVRTTLDSLKVRREEAARSTAHGLDFQDAPGVFVQHEAQRLGDLFEDAKSTSGAISRCKVGDFVVALSPDSAAPGERIVVEAKADRSYSVKDALAELQTARENRQAKVGVFVFSTATAPSGIEPLNRWGQDIVTVWDADDPNTDIYVKAALSLARLMVVKEANASEATSVCVLELDGAVATLTRDTALLDEISRLASTVRSNGEKIVDRSDSLRRKLDNQLDSLRNLIDSLRTQRSIQ